MMHPLFTAHPLFDKAWQDYFTVVVAVILTILVFKLRNESKNINGYSSRLAWIRGGIYFTECFLASWGMGVFKTLTRSTWITTDNLASSSLLRFTVLCIIVATKGLNNL